MHIKSGYGKQEITPTLQTSPIVPYKPLFSIVFSWPCIFQPAAWRKKSWASPGFGTRFIDKLDGPYGDASESAKGDGVGWFSTVGHDLLGVEFDDVEYKKDHQILFFDGGLMVEVKVNNGKVTVAIDKKKKIG